MADVIEKTVLLRAPRSRVWTAIGDSQAFGAWFGMTIDGPFVAGRTVEGKIAKTQVDPDVAKQQEPYVGMRCVLFVEEVEPERLLAFRWHPGAEADVGPDAPTTRVTFRLMDDPEGTRLTIVESGFEAIPLERRAKVFAENDGGWEMQVTLIARYLDAA
jgi:uncharacterized protein YndB with AHSA1/START domain